MQKRPHGQVGPSKSPPLCLSVCALDSRKEVSGPQRANSHLQEGGETGGRRTEPQNPRRVYLSPSLDPPSCLCAYSHLNSLTLLLPSPRHCLLCLLSLSFSDSLPLSLQTPLRASTHHLCHSPKIPFWNWEAAHWSLQSPPPALLPSWQKLSRDFRLSERTETNHSDAHPHLRLLPNHPLDALHLLLLRLPLRAQTWSLPFLTHAQSSHPETADSPFPFPSLHCAHLHNVSLQKKSAKEVQWLSPHLHRDSRLPPHERSTVPQCSSRCSNGKSLADHLETAKSQMPTPTLTESQADGRDCPS
mmetsp:Transcript_49085/g.96789  ORF Transcript_49085/g.96789 Transcript_49085/m.96789 type:complete len:302 (+) Transcript_49085:40-945(+)